MAIDRAWYDELVDDSGSTEDGSAWDKAKVKSLLDAIDDLFQSTGGIGIPIALTPGRSEAPASNAASATTRNSRKILQFDASTIESAMWTDFLLGYRTGTITVHIYWASAGATSGDVVWGVAWERMSGLDLDGDSFATEQTVTGTADATNGKYTHSEITFASDEIDGVLDGEPFRLRLRRIADDAADTMTGDADFLLATVEFEAVRSATAIVAELGGNADAYTRPASGDAYPSGATFDTLVPGSGVWYVDSDDIEGTVVLEAIAKVEGAGARVKLALFNLDDGAPDTALTGSEIEFTADNTTGERKRSSTITLPTGGTEKQLAVKATTDDTGIGAAAWGIRLVRTS